MLAGKDKGEACQEHVIWVVLMKVILNMKSSLSLTPFFSSYLLHFLVRHILRYFILEYYMHYISHWETKALKFKKYI